MLILLLHFSISAYSQKNKEPDTVLIGNIMAIAEKYMSEGHYRDAIESFGQVLDIDPRHYKARLDRAHCCIYLFNYQQAKQDISLLYRYYKGDRSILLEKAKLYYDMGLFGDAKFPIEVYTKKLPDDPEGWLLFGMLEIKCKRYGHALNLLDKANALYGGENYRCFAAKANVYLNKGEYDLAEKEILNAIRIDPSKGMPYYYLGLIDLRNHDTLSSISHFETAIGVDIYNAPVVELASKGLLRVGRIDLAREIYEDELARDSTNYDTWTRLGYIQYLSGKYQESFDSYQHALSINDEYISQVLYNQGAILWTMGKREEGKEYMLRSSEYGNYNAKMFLAQPASAGLITGIVAVGILQAFNVY